MTALLVSDIFPPKTGGSGRWFWEIARRLPREAFLVAAGEDPRQEAFDRTHDLRVVRTPLHLLSCSVTRIDDLKHYGRAIRALRELVRAEGITLVLCGRCLPEGLMGLVLKWWTGTPYAVFAHGEEINRVEAGTNADSRESAGMMTSRQYRWLTGKVLNGAAQVIANTRNTRSLLSRDWHLPDERVRLLYPGVDTRRFAPAPRRQDVRARLGWGERPVVLTVSRLQKRKGHDQMIRALPAIRRHVPDVLYAIAGDGPERNELGLLTVELGLEDSVQFLGETDERALVECYQQSDVFVLPNRQIGTDVEGFGMVLLEAQACGKPVIAGASGGTAETMRIPESGWVVPCEGPDELAKAVGSLLADAPRRKRMGMAAREWVLGRFDWGPLSREAAELLGLLAADVRPQAAAALVPVNPAVR